MVSLSDALEAISQQRQASGYRMQPKCDESEINRLRAESHEMFGASPPESYFDLLRITNGFWENGLHVYSSRPANLLPPEQNAATNGFIEATCMYRTGFRGFESLLVFAEDDAYVYALNCKTGTYVKQAYAEAIPSKEFGTFDELMIEAIKSHLIAE